MQLTDDTTVEVFPLERPARAVRRRGWKDTPPSLPYFVAGPENHSVALACRGELEIFELGNPILLTGPIGSGKTSIAIHLAARAAACKPSRFFRATDGKSDTERDPETRKSEPGRVVSYSGADLARSFAEAVSADDLGPLRDELSGADVLVIDDLHSMADKAAAQEELALRIEARYQAGRPTILTCKRLPSEIRGIRSRLASRAVPGLTLPVALPQHGSRLQLLNDLALHLGLEIGTPEIEQMNAKLAPAIPVRAMEAAMQQLLLWCRMNQQSVTPESIDQAIQSADPSRDVSINEITNSVAKYFRLRSSDLRSASRKQNLVRARSLAMWLARQVTGLSMYQIGESFGGRDHTTVLHGIRKTEACLANDAALKRAADELLEKLS